MKKFLVVLCLLALTACNLPMPEAPSGLSPNDQAATIVAQTLAALPASEQAPLASPTVEEYPTYGQPVFPSATAGGPAATIQPQATPTAGTGTPSATTLTVDSNTNCREGPGTTYKIVIILVAGSTYQMIGRTADNEYWIVTEIGKSTPCWVPAEFSNALGNTSLLPVVTPSAPTAAASGSPAAPSSLRYNYSCAFNADASYTITVALSWTDRSDNESGFYVYRNDALIATLPAGTTTYTDIFVGGGTQIIKYQVAAYNATGQALGGAQAFSCSS